MICSFCATQLPADAVYCAECGRPVMSRRARRATVVAPTSASSHNLKRARTDPETADSQSHNHRHKHERGAVVAATLASPGDDEIVSQPSTQDQPAAEVSADGGAPIVLSHTFAEPQPTDDEKESLRGESAQMEPSDDEEAMPDGDGLHNDALPFDEDRPYGEVASPETHDSFGPAKPRLAQTEIYSALGVRVRDLPAPIPADITQSLRSSEASADEGGVLFADPAAGSSSAEVDWQDEADARDLGARDTVALDVDDTAAQDNNALAVSEIDGEAVAATEPEPEPEPVPEPLVEPSPLPRSPFEPDLSRVGRPENGASAPESHCVKPVRPQGDEPIFTTDGRLRASAFAPVASERVSDQPAPPDAAIDGEPDVAVPTGTAPRSSRIFGSRPRAAATSRDETPNPSDSSLGEGTAVGASPAATKGSDEECSQCGASLSESDIFCGSCGFVKRGVGPGPRAVAVPALDPFPWGTPTARPDTTNQTTHSVPAAQANPAEIAERTAPVVDANVELDAKVHAPAGNPDGDQAPAEIDEEPAASASVDGSATLGLSVLAPPPMSHHRVELPVSPLAPLASGASDDEDIEDTRIVDRSVSGTRFVLQFSTGDSVIVTGTGLVGRNPVEEPSETFEIMVPIMDPSKFVSKTHLEFGQMAGAFWISDRYSGNGTVIREPGGKPKRCEPGKRYRVMRGSRVEIGEQFFIIS